MFQCVEKSIKLDFYTNVNTVDFDVFDFYHRGVPQHRRRLIAGSPEIVARLRRAPCVHRSVCDVIAEPRGTHVRNYVSKAPVSPYTVVNGKRVWLAFKRAAQGSAAAGQLWGRLAALVMTLTQSLFTPSVRLVCYVDDPLAGIYGSRAERRLYITMMVLVWRALDLKLAFPKGQTG